MIIDFTNEFPARYPLWTGSCGQIELFEPTENKELKEPIYVLKDLNEIQIDLETGKVVFKTFIIYPFLFSCAVNYTQLFIRVKQPLFNCQNEKEGKVVGKILYDIPCGLICINKPLTWELNNGALTTFEITLYGSETPVLTYQRDSNLIDEQGCNPVIMKECNFCLTNFNKDSRERVLYLKNKKGQEITIDTKNSYLFTDKRQKHYLKNLLTDKILVQLNDDEYKTIKEKGFDFN